ncbi:SDR family oxidoreductase [Acidiphilium sp. AL]|uniref:SDR family oxidoreductase n=1 Tax=Acidiphilium iwatense TaxID=768198 RepID=A0ABS9DZK6_9PROT|nr:MULTISPECIES: SDR family oxidoreductase [Acidiphilium]MCF3948195.1 SDR family oxidoreductase [Acidiphilium iwatense]MCU4161688.1 SDR family oxidoreductase [Acidiphilium sp. AL]
MLHGKTILVTGAARGLGYAIAQACAAAGARLVLADRLIEAGQEEVGTLRETGADARFVPVDLADPESIEAMARDIAAHEGRLDGLVNNAAIATNVGGVAFDAIEIDLFDRVMRVNIRGTWLMTRAIAPILVDGGAIVNLASDTALWGAPHLLAYVASKGAVIAMTRSLARELGERRIAVTAVAPGIVRTEATEYVPEARHRLYEEQRAVPGPQLPEDVAGVVVFLLTPSALSLTGQLLTANAGFVFA